MISSLIYKPNHIPPPQAKALADTIDQNPWRADLKRRVQHYGYVYDYKARSIDPSMYLGELPDWLQATKKGIEESLGLGNYFDQAIVNEYRPGQGIAPHVDCQPCFEDTIAIISLLSPIEMQLKRLKDGEKHSLWLEPNSLLVLQGESRNDWQHSIPARKSDKVDGMKVPRQRRVSITFRKVKLQKSQ